MASLVEKETGVPQERGQIAGVFVRRMALGMQLQTDPTVIYGLGERYTGKLTRAHLKEATPYNTYVIAGLPPTPIAMVGREAIHAALNPVPGKSLYFVARGDGSHVFSDDLDAHNSAVREFQLKRRADYRSSPAPQAQQSTPDDMVARLKSQARPWPRGNRFEDFEIGQTIVVKGSPTVMAMTTRTITTAEPELPPQLAGAGHLINRPAERNWAQSGAGGTWTAPPAPECSGHRAAVRGCRREARAWVRW